jgi:hypothetical protein
MKSLPAWALAAFWVFLNSCQIDNWYTFLQENGDIIKDSLETLQNLLVRVFVAYDPDNYFIEFDQFLEDPKNQIILELLR